MSSSSKPTTLRRNLFRRSAIVVTATALSLPVVLTTTAGSASAMSACQSYTRLADRYYEMAAAYQWNDYYYNVYNGYARIYSSMSSAAC